MIQFVTNFSLFARFKGAIGVNNFSHSDESVEQLTLQRGWSATGDFKLNPVHLS